MIVAGFSAPATAQNAPGIHQDNGGLNGSLTRGDLEKLSGDHRNSPTEPKDTPEERAKAKVQSAALLQSLQISCDVGDAKLIVAGKTKPKTGGKEVDTRLYEVACINAMGYLLEAQGDTPLAISCLTAEEARAADVTKGKAPSYFCQLPGNADVYALVRSMIIDGTGAQCTVQALQGFGRSESMHSDYSEIACTDGNGFLLRMAQPGFQAKTVVMSCIEAAKQGIKCKMTDTGSVESTVVTTQTFKDALAHNGVTCPIGQIRVVGQEEHLKRYVVEYLCADQATGTVAFIPLSGNTNPFESQGCAAALTDRGVKCSLAPMN
jgi:hypothetical protein